MLPSDFLEYVPAWPQLRGVLTLAVAASACTVAPASGSAAARMNVLFVGFDDLNDWITPLDPTAPIAMPNLERAARRGTLFSRAYCAAPECNPSRTALLSGLRPTTSGVYANDSDWKQAMPDAMMLPHYFRQNGYRTVGAGKIFHHTNEHFYDAASFDDYLPYVSDRLPAQKLNGLTRARTPDGEWEALAPTFDWGPAQIPTDQMLDVRSADYAARFLGQSHEKPFFLAVGFFRPHLPYLTPPDALKRYDPKTMRLPEVKADELAEVPSGGLALMRRWARMFRGIQQSPDPQAKWREAIAAYAAGATFADEQLGRVLDALDRSPYKENTIVVIWSDHGYHLGEKNHWTKFVLWEKSTRVPLVIVAPGTTQPGTTCVHPVSLLDLYPTLVELCGLPERKALDGNSLVPLLKQPASEAKGPALMTEMRGNHAVRTDRWRYIRYADGTQELYDDDADPREWHNLALAGGHEAIIAELARWLPKNEAKPAADYVAPPGTQRN